MVKSRHDKATLDLLSWEPPKIAPKLDADRVRGANPAARTALAFGEAMNASGKKREDIAKLLSSFLDEDVSRDILDAYASQARERNNVPAYRLLALVAVLDDPSILNSLLDGTRFMVVDKKFGPLIDRDLALEARERMDRFIEASSAAWKSKR